VKSFDVQSPACRNLVCNIRIYLAVERLVIRPSISSSKKWSRKEGPQLYRAPYLHVSA
jgi:hypothetical protein